ncbi:hypothetical protein IWW38_004744, partial [Coemansia aciculifera]
MYCRRCGEIVVSGEATCKKCGGRAVESTTGAGAMNTSSNERKDPWTSKYMQRRLNPSNINKGGGSRPMSTAITSSASFDSGHAEFEYHRAPPPVAQQRPVTTGSPSTRPTVALGPSSNSRPVSMYSAHQQQQPSPPVVVTTRGLKSKWSQYFTSTAATESDDAAGPAAAAMAGGGGGGPRVRSESLSAPLVHQSHSRLPPAQAAGPSAVARVSAASAAAVRGAPVSSPLIGSPLIVERSRSATLPDQSAGAAGSRPCTTCRRSLRAEEQRQFATQPGLVYCTGCYHSSYSRGSCAGCNKVVLTHGRPWAQYGDRVWHKLCIRCRSCNRLLVTPLVDKDGEPSCDSCFDSGRGGEEEPPMPRAIGGSTVCPRPPPSPVSGRSSAATPKVFGTFEAPAKALDALTIAHASIPTPVLSEYGGSALRIMTPDEVAAHQGLPPPPASEHRSAKSSVPRIMSPVEVAAHQGLPPPRAIVDPDSPAAPAEPLGILQPSSRTASPRSVSFRIDESEKEEEEEAEAMPQPRSLADYVLSKA